MPGDLGHRRFSSSGSIQSLPAAPPPPFVPMTGGLSPVFGSNRMPPVMGRPLSSYANQPLQPQGTSSPPYQQFYGDSPYMNRAPMGESPISRDPQESSYLESPVRLPPIFPPMPTNTTETTSPTGHRLSDPYPYTTGATWSPRTREEQLLPQERRPPVVGPAQPGLMEPVSPQTQIYHHHHTTTTIIIRQLLSSATLILTPSPYRDRQNPSLPPIGIRSTCPPPPMQGMKRPLAQRLKVAMGGPPSVGRWPWMTWLMIK